MIGQLAPGAHIHWPTLVRRTNASRHGAPPLPSPLRALHRHHGRVLGYCVTSQSEPNPGEFVGKMQTPHGHFDIKGKLKVNNACGGLHTVVPIAELQSLLGTSLAP